MQRKENVDYKKKELNRIPVESYKNWNEKFTREDLNRFDEAEKQIRKLEDKDQLKLFTLESER